MKSSSKAPTQRQLRVGEQIRHIISDCFLRGDLPKDLPDCPAVSILEARISPDFSFCKVYISVLSIDAGADAVLVKELNKYRGFFRTILAKNMRLRVVPEVRFFTDRAQGEADKIDALLASEKVQRDLTARHDDEIVEE